MIKGLAITPPLLGRISIGRVIEKAGKRLPEKDDQFTLTTQVQNKEGWMLHPLDAELRKDAPNGKLRSIPVRMLFNDPDLNLRAAYTLFDRSKGRPLCVGDGDTCRRLQNGSVETLPCPSPDVCEVGRGACKPFGRLNVKLTEDDELGSFIFRTTGFNSIRVLTARLRYFSAVSGNRLAYLPLALRLRGKSTTQSHRAPIYYVDLTLRDGMTLGDAVIQAKDLEAKREAAGICQDALEEAARLGFANGISEESVEDTPALVEELFAEDAGASGEEAGAPTPTGGLKDKLGEKAKAQAASEGGAA